MAALHHQRLILSHQLQIFFNQPVLHPVLAHLPSLTVCNQLIGVESDVEGKVVIDHRLKCFPFQTVSIILIDRLRPQVTSGAKAVAVYPSTCFQLIQELGCHPTVQLSGNVS